VIAVADALYTLQGLRSFVAKEGEEITMMWGYNMTGMSWWMIISSLIWLGLVAIAVWAFARWASRPTQSNASGSPPAPSATEIVRQRFARGEIDSDTFERMRRQLETSPVK
jgi:putative membrane protein